MVSVSSGTARRKTRPSPRSPRPAPDPRSPRPPTMATLLPRPSTPVIIAQLSDDLPRLSRPVRDKALFVVLCVYKSLTPPTVAGRRLRASGLRVLLKLLPLFGTAVIR